MKCSMCGYCCTHFDLIIAIDPDKGFVEGNLAYKPGGMKCMHNLDDGRCAVHDRDWYDRTSCYHYDFGNDNLCEFTPGKATVNQLLRGVRKHDPRFSKQPFTQDMLMLLNDELVAKNIAVKKNRDKREGLYDPKDR